MANLIILIFFSFLALPFEEVAKERFVFLCKNGSSKLYVTYAESAFGINRIVTSINADTLQLKVFVKVLKENKDNLLEVSPKINFVKVGKRGFKIDDLKVCSSPKSGKEAIEELKKLK